MGNPKNRPLASHPTQVILIILAFLVLVGLACSLSDPTPAVWAVTLTAQARSNTATAFASTQAANYKPLPTLTKEPTKSAPTPTSAAASLFPQGPWLLYPTRAGQALVALNPDGSGSTTVAIPPLLDLSDLTDGLSPNGDLVAFRTGLHSNPEDTVLNLLSLPSGHLQAITDLLSPAEKDLVRSGTDSRAVNAAEGVIQANSLAWSPDGQYLAFIAAIDRNASDLYIYDTQSKQITRMTFGTNMYVTPFWSPDGHWIFVQEVLSYNQDGGWTPGVVWKIDAQTDLTYEIYTPPANSLGEVFLGWANDTSFLSYSRLANGGETLRAVDTNRAKVTTLYNGSFNQMVFDPASKIVAFTIYGSQSGTASQEDGIYLLKPGDTQPSLIQAGNWQDLQWFSTGNVFLASGTQGSLIVTKDGNVTLIANEDHAVPSPDGNWLACWGDSSSGSRAGLRLYRSSGGVLQEVTTDPIQALVWQPDSKGFFFISGNHLDLATFPSLQVRTLDPDIRPGVTPGLIWVP